MKKKNQQQQLCLDLFCLCSICIQREIDQLCTLTQTQNFYSNLNESIHSIVQRKKSSKDEKPNVLNEIFWQRLWCWFANSAVRATALQLGTKRITVLVASLCKSEWDKFCRFACETNQMLYAHMHTHLDSHRAHAHIQAQRDIWTNASSQSNDMKQTKRQFRSTAFEVVNNVIYTTSV